MLYFSNISSWFRVTVASRAKDSFWSLLLLNILISPHAPPDCCSAGSEYHEFDVLLPWEHEIWQIPQMLYFPLVLAGGPSPTPAGLVSPAGVRATSVDANHRKGCCPAAPCAA